MSVGYGQLLQQFTPRPDDRPQVAECLTVVAEVLIEDGWCQTGLRDTFGRRCLLGALLIAAHRVGGDGWVGLHDSTREWLVDELAVRHGWTGYPETWNDREATKVDDVLDLIAATRARIGGEL